MKKVLFIIAMLYVSIVSAQGIKTGVQKNDLIYFIMANSDNYDGYTYMKPEPSYFKLLYRLEKDSLMVVDTLNTKVDLKMNTIYNIQPMKLLYFEESRLDEYDTEYYSILDYQDSFVLRRFEKSFDLSFKDSGPLSFIKRNDTFIIINEWEQFGDPKINKLYGRDKYFNKYAITDEELNNNFLAFGNNGSYNETYNFGLYLYLWGNYDALRLFKFKNYDDFLGKKYDKLLKASVQIPLKYIDTQKGKGVDVIINNKDYFASLVLNKDRDKSLVIYDKNREEWQCINEYKARDRIMIWQGWLYGMELNNKRDWDLWNDCEQKYDFEYGRCPKRNFEEFNDYFSRTGILFIYNIKEKKYIKWDTKDHDSEILNINKGVIYYRVFDEIYSIELDSIENIIKWDTKKTIIKDRKRVPNIHWMFFSYRQDNIKEEWVNRPINEDELSLDLRLMIDNNQAKIVWYKYKDYKNLCSDTDFIKEYIDIYGYNLRGNNPFEYEVIFGENKRGTIKGGFWRESKYKKIKSDIMGVSSFQALKQGFVRLKEGTALVKLEKGYYIGDVEVKIKFGSYRKPKYKWKEYGKTVFLPKEWNNEKIREEIVKARKKANFTNRIDIYESFLSDGTKVILGRDKNIFIPLLE